MHRETTIHACQWCTTTKKDSYIKSVKNAFSSISFQPLDYLNDDIRRIKMITKKVIKQNARKSAKYNEREKSRSVQIEKKNLLE